MRLAAFRIQRFRSIVDSGWIDVEPLTAVVGKNESGKTTILEALHRLNPFRPLPFSIDRDWPRSQRRSRNEDQPVVEARFTLAPGEALMLSEMSEGRFREYEIEIARDYKGRLMVRFPSGVFDRTLIGSPIEQVAVSAPEEVLPVGDAFRDQARRCRAEARRLVLESRFSQIPDLAASHGTALEACYNPWNPEPSHQNEQIYFGAHMKWLARIETAAANAPQQLAAAHEAIVTRMPTIMLMDDYHAFHGSAALDEVLQRKRDHAMRGEDLTLEMIFDLAGLSLEHEVKRAKDGDREQRQYDLDDAATMLTQAIEGRWNQLRYEVKFAADGHQFFTFVKDQRDQALIKLEERSKGFQWFFSFDLMLMYESRGRFKDCIILLDEPGLSLHPTAQRDLLRLLEEYSESNTLLYTTHLPFMLDLGHPERIRVLNDTREGIVATSDLTQVDPEAKHVLEAALAIGAGASFTMAARNLIVEGLDDCWIVGELSNLFNRSGLEGLPDDVLIMPANTAPSAAYIATLMVGWGLDVAVLLSCRGGESSAAADLIQGWITRYSSSVSAEVVTLAEAVGAPDRDTGAEDYFPDDYYLDAVHTVYAKEFATAGVEAIEPSAAEARLSSRVETTLVAAGVTFNARAVATLLRGRLARMKSVDELPEETRSRAARLFASINRIFSKEKHFWSVA